MSSPKAVNIAAMNPRAQSILSQYSGGYVVVRGAEVVQFVGDDLAPVELPSDIKDEIVKSVPCDGSYWVRPPEAKSEAKAPPKPKREDFPDDEVGYFRAAAAHHAAVNG